MENKSLKDLEEFLNPIATELNMEIIDIEFKNGKDSALTVFIDKEGGVDLNACEAFHRAIDEPLDEFDFTNGKAFTLNVSSPGLDRAFKKAKDYLRNIGKEVEVKLFAPLKGKKLFDGELLSYDGNSIEIKIDKETVKLSITQIAKISQAIKFE